MIAKKAKKWIAGSFLLGTTIYVFSPGPVHLMSSPSGWNLQAQFMYLTGICAMTLMIGSMLISLRLPSINSIFGGLDKAYEVHKWTGIVTTLFVLIHWLGDKIPLLLITFKIVSDPKALIDISQYTRPEIVLYKSGTLLAELLFYFFLFLVVVSLARKIPYKFFRTTHKFIPGVFLIYAYHGATAPLKDHWYKDPGILIVLLLVAMGSVIAMIALFRQIGRSRRAITVIRSIGKHNTGVIDLSLQAIDKPFHHQAGQFAFLQFAHSTEPHPFTIASSGRTKDTLRFCIKGLGDFTKDLQKNIRVGQSVIVEGPYGEFRFDDTCGRQIWVAGGIGITPFMAQLDHLSLHGGTKRPVDFWYCTKGELDYQFPESLKQLCQTVGVKLHHLNANQGEFFSAGILKNKFDNLDDFSILFCGPVPLKRIVIDELRSCQFNMNNFHSDSFNLR